MLQKTEQKQNRKKSAKHTAAFLMKITVHMTHVNLLKTVQILLFQWTLEAALTNTINSHTPNFIHLKKRKAWKNFYQNNL